MIGNVIQARYLQVTDYPTASALSFVLMLAILVGLFIYARLDRDRGTDRGVRLMTATATPVAVARRAPAAAARSGRSTAGCCPCTSSP